MAFQWLIMQPEDRLPIASIKQKTIDRLRAKLIRAVGDFQFSHVHIRPQAVQINELKAVSKGSLSSVDYPRIIRSKTLMPKMKRRISVCPPG